MNAPIKPKPFSADPLATDYLVARELVDASDPTPPARILEGHAQDNILNTVAGAKVGWRNKDVLDKLHTPGAGDPSKLEDATVTDPSARAIAANRRYEAGSAYRTAFLVTQSSGGAAFDSARVATASGPMSFPDYKLAASAFLRETDARLGKNDMQIVLLVCCAGYRPSEAVTHVCGNAYRHATLARLREALDALVVATDAARKIKTTKVSRGTFDGSD